MGQVFIFITISKFGALTCSIIGLARKVTTLVASIYFYGHHLNGIQFAGLCAECRFHGDELLGKEKGASTYVQKKQVSEEAVNLIHYTDQDAQEEEEDLEEQHESDGNVELPAVKNKESAIV